MILKMRWSFAEVLVAPHSAIPARPWRCSRMRDGSRGACSAAHIRSRDARAGPATSASRAMVRRLV